jgi:hypothetical protein
MSPELAVTQPQPQANPNPAPKPAARKSAKSVPCITTTGEKK